MVSFSIVVGDDRYINKNATPLIFKKKNYIQRSKLNKRDSQRIKLWQAAKRLFKDTI